MYPYVLSFFVVSFFPMFHFFLFCITHPRNPVSCCRSLDMHLSLEICLPDEFLILSLIHHMTKLSWEFPLHHHMQKAQDREMVEKAGPWGCRKNECTLCEVREERKKCWVTAVKVPCHMMCHRIPAERGRHFPNLDASLFQPKKNFSPSSKQQNKTTEAAKLH